MDYNNYFAERMNRLSTESAFGILAEANKLEAEGKNVIHMEIGQPDFKTPENIVEAGCKAIRNGYTGYAPAGGYPFLKDAIAEYAYKYKGINVSRENIIVTPGGKPIMFFTMLLLINHGDEVIYPNPGFPIYENAITFAGGKPVPYALKAENGFKLTPEVLEELITEKTKRLIINNPSNPTGGIMNSVEIEKIAEVLRKHENVFVLSDEIYDRLVYENDVKSIASCDGMKERTIILDGFSKTYSMTGWRIGYGIMNSSFAEGIERLMINSNSCTASFTQVAALEALKGPQDSVFEMKNAFKERRDFIVDALNRIPGIKCFKPGGAFYVFPDISSFGLRSKDFYHRFLHEAYVASSWGSSFGEFGEGCIRLSFATSLENIKEAVSRLESFTKLL